MTAGAASARLRVGFIGLGDQGAPMARRIVDAGYPLTIWARRPATLAPFADSGAVVADSPAEVGAASDLVGICVVDDAGVEAVVAGDGGVLYGMGPGGVIAVHSTIHPDTCRRLAERAAAQGVSVVDAPVSGGREVAAQGRLLVMVGGDAAAVERARPVFATFGDPVLHLGPVGAGQITKLLNNALFTAQLGLAADTFALAAGIGLDRGEVTVALERGSGASAAVGIVAAAGFTTAVVADHAGALLRKDVALIADVVERAGVPGGHLLTAAEATLAGFGRRGEDLSP